MRFIFLGLLLFPMAFVSADSSKTSTNNKSASASDLNQFRSDTMEILDNPFCRTTFKSYLKLKQPKVFLYATRSKENNGYCTHVARKTEQEAEKIVIDRCNKNKKKFKKNKFTSPCEIIARNHTLLKTRADFGLKPHTKDIFYVSERGGVDELKKIVEAGVDINQTDSRGFTPLLIAVDENNLEVVKFLIEKGADITVKNKKGFNALIIAANENHQQVFEYLLNKGADIISTDPRNGRQAIHIAARGGSIGILDILLKKGVNINQETIHKELPLHLAVQSLYLPTVKYLVEKGADINAIDRSGKTALDMAKKLGIKRIINYLSSL